MKVINQSSGTTLITAAEQTELRSTLQHAFITQRNISGFCRDSNEIKMLILQTCEQLPSDLSQKLLHGRFLEIKAEHMLLNTAAILFNKKVIIIPSGAIRGLLEILIQRYTSISVFIKNF